MGMWWEFGVKNQIQIVFCFLCNTFKIFERIYGQFDKG